MKIPLLLSVLAAAVAQDVAPSMAPTRVGDVVVNIKMKVDGNASASNVGWSLASENGDYQIAVPFGAYSPTDEVVDQVLVPGGEDFNFTIKERGGEGLGPGGAYEVFMDDGFGNYVLASGLGNFTGEQTSMFFLPSDPDQLPANSPTVFVPTTPTPPTSPTAAPVMPVPAVSSTFPPADSSPGMGVSALLLGSTIAAVAYLL